MDINRNTRMEDIDPESLTPEEAKAAFATKYDEPIQQILEVLLALGYTSEEFEALLESWGRRLSEVIDVPVGLTVEESRPFVEISDAVILGDLNYQLYLRRDTFREALGDVPWTTES